MPGTSEPLAFAGLELTDTFPLLPLARGVPLAVGALSWDGQLCVSFTTDPDLLTDAVALAFASRVDEGFQRLRRDLDSPAHQRHEFHQSRPRDGAAG
jgi:diacylglycerol O-acyltransferase